MPANLENSAVATELEKVSFHSNPKERQCQRNISCKDGHNKKDRNVMDLTEAEDIKKRWQEYTELYKKDLHVPDNHDCVITHLEPDILECEAKLALEA